MRRLLGTALATALFAALGAVVADPASAAPPVANDDHETVYAAGYQYIDVLANDSDPDGDELKVCRIGDVSEPAPSVVDTDGETVVVGLFPDGVDVVTITYYACDFQTMVPATLTITVQPVEFPRVTKTARPGVLRLTNPNDHVAVFRWGTAPRGRFTNVDGRERVAAHDSVTIRVHRHVIDWAAFYPDYLQEFGSQVRGIKLPKDH